MQIIIDSKKIVDALTQMQMKGKYYVGGQTKVSSIGSNVVMVVSGNNLTLYNANHVAVCRQTLNVNARVEGECAVDSDKLISQMKAFKGNVTIDAGEHLTISQGNSKMKMPLLLNHSSPAGIAQARTLNMPNSVPVIIGRKTEIKTRLLTSWVHLSDAVKGCDVLGIGRYKFDYDEHSEVLKLSSDKSANESFSTNVDCGEVEGEGATVEITGPFLSFFDKTDMINIYLRDDSPIMFASNGGAKILVKAPYIGRN
tara:strand:+ start:623 stop:1387 length:765 start_codon:yes stop_codon:yes gene_type:complete